MTKKCGLDQIYCLEMWLRTDKSLRNVAYTNSMTQKCDLDKYYDLEMRLR